jgi:hypothetical protein
MVGLWVMEVLVIPMLGSDLYDEGLVSYGFATHVWETGGRDLVRIEMVSRRGGRGRVAGSSVEVSVGDGGRMSCVICIAERWYEMTVKSMGSGSVWCG